MVALAWMALIWQMPAAMPFLPRGKGALILIQGGLVVLGFSLLWSLLTPRGAPVVQGGGATPRRAVIVQPPTRPVQFLERPTQPILKQFQKQTWTEVPARAPAFVPVPNPTPVQQTSANWVGSVLEKAMRPRVGRTRLLSANPQWFILTVNACRSCRERSKGPSGCAVERAHIEECIRPTAPKAVVTEVSCNLLGHGACTFKVERGRTA